jgi:hypothetical protein
MKGAGLQIAWLDVVWITRKNAHCDQEDETIDHLIMACIFARQFWYLIMRQVGLHSLVPGPNDLFFDEWWEKVHLTTSALTRRGLNSLIILGAWILCNQRNRCVFDGDPPNMTESLIILGNEIRMWMMAAAQGLSHSMAPLS